MSKLFPVLLLTACLAAACGTLKKGAEPVQSGNEPSEEAMQAAGKTRAPESALEATPLGQIQMGIQPGEYSGITWLGGDRYAVVSDDLKGGGILLFNIPIDKNGIVGTVSVQPVEGTTAATGEARDCEGIAYVPATGKLYVSAESDQEIREYDLAGRETGKALAVPKIYKKIQPNRGFEALTYDPATELFWTTTEAPLQGETLLRLQSFSRDGKAGGSFLYELGKPLKSSAGARAYVFGVPALAALPDGRLLVLEREVYVPGGGIWEKFTESFTKMDLYMVDPVRDQSDKLRKTRLCSFRTSALTLANYEGMCLGPTLPDGRRVLLLVADSENGSGGLTNEFVKVILLK